MNCQRTTARRFLLCAILAIAALMFLGSCSGQPPELSQLFWQLNVVYNPENSSQHEELSLFVHAEDPDGIQDVDQLELLHSEQELLWSFNAEQWRMVEREGESWIGTNGVRSSSDPRLPRGEYRIRVSDKAGESVETTFIISRDIIGLQNGSLVPGRFPSVEIEPQRLKLSAAEPEILVSLYAGEGDFLRSEMVELSGGTAEIENWAARWSAARQLRLQQYDAGGGYGLVSGPYELTPEQRTE